MTSDFIIRPGDQVICVDAELSDPPHRLQLECKDRLKQRAIYLVVDVVWLYGEKGLHLRGLDHRPTDGWRASRFRRLVPEVCEEGSMAAERSLVSD